MIQARFVLLLTLLMINGLAFTDDTAEPTKAEEITAAATEYRQALEFDGETFSGPAWDRLIARTRCCSASCSPRSRLRVTRNSR